MSADRRVAALVVEALRDGPRTTRALLTELRGRGAAGLSRAALERVLGSDPRIEPDPDASKGGWRLAPAADDTPAVDGAPGPGASGDRPGSGGSAGPGAAPGPDAAPGPGTPAVVGGGATRAAWTALALRDWQVEALAAWAERGRGVVEAVTGTGKTRLALAAVRAVVDRGGVALVLVPTLELQRQWVDALAGVVPRARIGRLGGGASDDLDERDVVVATPSSAAALPIEPPPGRLGLLVADEAHRYGAPTWGAALRDTFALRLALTATFERGDDGVVEVLEPYFGGVVLRYGFDRAVAEGTVAPFSVALVGVDLDERERATYDEADRRVRRAHGELIAIGGVPRDPRELIPALAAIVADAARSGDDGPLARAARDYLARVRERRDVAAGARAKLDVLAAMAPGLAGRRTLVFTDTVEQAEAAARRLARAGVRAEELHGGLADERRRIRLAQFRRGAIDALVAPRVLDEGVDVPDADVAVALSAFRTRRHLVQRLGRVLRVKPDGRAARLVLVHATDTLEDPARGGHADFLSEVTGVARALDAVVPARLAAWLSAGGADAGLG